MRPSGHPGPHFFPCLCPLLSHVFNLLSQPALSSIVDLADDNFSLSVSTLFHLSKESVLNNGAPNSLSPFSIPSPVLISLAEGNKSLLSFFSMFPPCLLTLFLPPRFFTLSFNSTGLSSPSFFFSVPGTASFHRESLTLRSLPLPPTLFIVSLPYVCPFCVQGTNLQSRHFQEVVSFFDSARASLSMTK